jgi:alkyl sulfatase BDS1-like metallo-beta-lactamase superfamily hydrolase
MVKGFGGVAAVRAQVLAARSENDLRWALELATWLATRSEAEPADRQLLADTLRDVGYRSSAANIRNWCITRARDLDGSTDLSRLREHRFRPAALAALAPRETLGLLRVLLDPARAAGIDLHIGFAFNDAPAAGLHIRNSVAVATGGADAGATLQISYGELIRIVCGQQSLDEAIARGHAAILGDPEAVLRALGAFDIPGLAK